jgi:hypothetical protein
MMNIKLVRIIFIKYFLGILSSEDINKIILKQQTLKKKNNSHSEYKIINSTEEDEHSSIIKSTDNSNFNNSIHDLNKEINQNSCMDVDYHEKENEDEHLDSDKIDDLKRQVLELDDEHHV